MKKIIFLLVALVASMGIQAQTSGEKKVERELSRAERRALQQKIDSVQWAEAMQAVADTAFTLEADHVVFKYGQRAYVSPTTNFVKVGGGRATVQVSFNIPVAGPNGMGGVTVDGTVTGYDVKTDKRGTAYVTLNVMGIGISAQLMITMLKGSNQASIDILPNFNSNRLTLEGTILPPSKSFVVKGRSL